MFLEKYTPDDAYRFLALLDKRKQIKCWQDTDSEVELSGSYKFPYFIHSIKSGMLNPIAMGSTCEGSVYLINPHFAESTPYREALLHFPSENDYKHPVFKYSIADGEIKS